MHGSPQSSFIHVKAETAQDAWFIAVMDYPATARKLEACQEHQLSTCNSDRRVEWNDKRIEQRGIEIRKSGAHSEMRRYLEILAEEIRMTKTFLKEDGAYIA